MPTDAEILHQIFVDGIIASTPEVPKDADGNYITHGSTQARPKMMRLMSLTLENFRAFRGETKFDFQCRNVLIYGENGSGKTSIWSALDLFLGAALAEDEVKSRAEFSKHRYQFNKEPGRVEFEVLDELGISTEVPRTSNYVWSRDDSPFQNPEIMPGARVSARLDYRAMWETYFVHRKSSRVNIALLLLETLIPHVATLSGPTFGEMWADLQQRSAKGLPRNSSNFHLVSEDCLLFGGELTSALENIKTLAQEILNHLAPSLKFEWKVTPPSLGSALINNLSPSHKGLVFLQKPRVVLSVSLNDNALKNHHNLLNEARLSALALSIYLAAAKINAAQARSGFKILALDDVLIGLDMSNRMPVLDVLQRYFSDWQIFLFTYDRNWYEIAATQLDQHNWKKFEFYASDDQPLFAEAMPPLERSRFYLDAARGWIPDYKAAGVYARSAFEIMLKRLYKRHKISLPYLPDDSYMLRDLWPLIEKLEKEGPGGTRVPLVEKALFHKVEAGKSQVYNPLCHSQSANFHKAEVIAALLVLDELDQVLDSALKVKIRSEAPVIVSSLGIDLRTTDLSVLTQNELHQLFGNVKAQLAANGRAGHK